MLYLKSALAGIGGSILALILYSVVMYVIAIRRFGPGGSVGILTLYLILHPMALAVIATGFVLGFYLVFRR